MTDTELIQDLHRMAGEQADAGNWQMAQQGYELLAHKTRLMALEAKQRADELHSRWSDSEPFSIGWAASLLYGGNHDN